MEVAIGCTLGSQSTTCTLLGRPYTVYPTEHLNTSITLNNKISTTPKHTANCLTKEFTNAVKHATHKTNKSINRATHTIQGYNITLTTSQVQGAIK